MRKVNRIKVRNRPIPGLQFLFERSSGNVGNLEEGRHDEGTSVVLTRFYDFQRLLWCNRVWAGCDHRLLTDKRRTREQFLKEISEQSDDIRLVKNELREERACALHFRTFCATGRTVSRQK